MEPLKVYIGWDSREDIAYKVAKHSIEKYASVPVEIVPLKQEELRSNKDYWRPHDKLGSTEFTFSRFLVPHLNNYKDWALFIDCDFLFLDDIKKLFDQIDDRYAIMCAQHDYTPKQGVKMDGQVQTVYPRKNWSSMMLINCAHPSNQQVTKEFVNDPEKDGKYLHRFSWLNNNEIGKISHEWNWLVGWYKEVVDGLPKALHYTEGGPWFKDYQRCEYAVDWLLMEKSYLKENKKKDKELIQLGKFDSIPAEHEQILSDILNHMIDPESHFYSESWNTITEKVKKTMGEKVVAIDTSEVNIEKKGLAYDPILENFVLGSNGRISTWDKEKDKTSTLAIRGVGGGSRKAIQHCQSINRPFYFVDTGYYGNGKMKKVHRVTKNNMQNLGPIIERPMDRAKQFGYRFKKFKPGSKILICPPSLKIMDLYNMPSPEDWVKQIVMKLKNYTDRPIEVRLKPTRQERVTNNTIQQALADDVHCLITYNSIASVEALMEGKPAIVLGPNAAGVIAETELSNIENPKIPNRDEMDAFMAHLAYCQFHVSELRSGVAWRIVNESS